MTISPADPTGPRFHLSDDIARVEVTTVGAALRAFEVGSVDVVPRYADTIATPAASGVVLVPWPNRVAGGAWTQRGKTYQLAVSEPATGAASHGLLRFTSYRPVSQASDSLTLTADVVPQTGYPFHLRTTVTYALSGGALTVTHSIENVGASAAPVALGTHPYLCIGGVDTADLTVQLDAPLRAVIDDSLIPIADEPVDEATDLRTPRRIGDLDLNTAYSGMPRDDRDRVRAVLAAPDGRTVELWAGPGFTRLQLFTTDRYPGQPVAIAIEPMTAPANAFNSGEDLHWIEPGETWTLEWGLTAAL
ncbi:aldose 1-epimerase family protein [uncultured Microbacterium sp.]|uniref:aldose 1-epimerase family protein n=1 Tax=uncultured Microbacterium sp. TaxID=191216 RepID=UPI002617EBE8|nr:aldose 1-epimerase family protein [uncultured Microbacterium sp.]